MATSGLPARRHKRGLPAIAQLFDVQEPAVSAEIARKRMIERARHVSGNRVERLVLAGKAVGATCIDQRNVALRQRRLDRLRVEHSRERLRRDNGGLNRPARWCRLRGQPRARR